MLKYFLTLFLMIQMSVQAITYNELSQILQKEPAPFSYNINVQVLKGEKDNEPVMICFHGYGSNYTIANVLQRFGIVKDHLVSFNFPDYNILETMDISNLSFGTIKELLPPLYLIKKCVIDAKLSSINLYGFSAGGGAIINTLSVLNSDRFDKELNQIGITKENKKTIITAIEKGLIILDSPMKSMQELMDARGYSVEFAYLTKQYNLNAMNPIDNLKNLKGLKLNILLNFQVPDEILSNRDDKIFISNLKESNKDGTNIIVIGHGGGHNSFHADLWKAYHGYINKK